MPYAVIARSFSRQGENPYAIYEIAKTTKTRVYFVKLTREEKLALGYRPDYADKKKIVAVFENYDEAEAAISRAHNRVIGMINTLNRDISDLQSKRTELVAQRRNEIKEAAHATYDVQNVQNGQNG